LLAAEDRSGDFLEQPADPRVGTRIGAWRVLARIGAGGMGVVYLAARDDGAYEQKVALKVLRHGADHAELLERFRRERQILAGLRHPNITQLIDGGATEDGAPWLVMEHVEGTRLDLWCDERRLPLARRLALFRDVCTAVACAHGNLVIHRDLKPSNILVTDDGQGGDDQDGREGMVKLVDFGVAKVLDPVDGGSATRTVERRLTPEYASPEVLRGETPATASDVYSLGVVLHELLAGRRPFQQLERSPTDFARRICESPPPRLSTAPIDATIAAARGMGASELRRALRGDLDAIVATALALEPARRYRSVAELSADVERHLAHQPIVARPPGALYVAAKFVRRRRTVAAALGVALLALLVGAVGLVSGSLRARRQAEATGRVNALMRDMLVQLDPTLSGGFSESLLKQLEFARDQLAAGLLKDEPELEVDLRFALGRVYGSLGYADWSTEQFEAALALAARCLPPRDPRHVQLESWLGWALRNGARFDDAERHLRAAIMLARANGGLEDDLRHSLGDLGRTLIELRRFDEAQAALEESLARWTAAGEGAGAEAAGVHAALALNELARGTADRAEPEARVALAISEKLLPAGAPRHAVALDTLARVLLAEGKPDEAETLLARSLEERRSLFDPHSPAVAWSLALLADAHCAAGRPGDAVALLEEALAIRCRTCKAGDQPRIQAELQLGLALIDAGRGSEGAPHLATGIAEADAAKAPSDARLERARRELSRATASK
jgi:serine/threonine-protein kinase